MVVSKDYPHDDEKEFEEDGYDVHENGCDGADESEREDDEDPGRGALPPEHAIHQCLIAKGLDPSCQTCPISRLGRCPELLNCINRFNLNLIQKGVADYLKRRDIIAETVIAVIRSIHTFEGRSRFTTWAYAVYRNCLAGYFKKINRQIHPDSAVIDHQSSYKEPGAGIDIPDPSPFSPDTSIDKEMIFEAILSNPNDPDYDNLQFLIRHYQKSCLGKSQKEIALDAGMLPNTYNQKLKRCRAVIKKRQKEKFNG